VEQNFGNRIANARRGNPSQKSNVQHDAGKQAVRTVVVGCFGKRRRGGLEQNREGGRKPRVIATLERLINPLHGADGPRSWTFRGPLKRKGNERGRRSTSSRHAGEKWPIHDSSHLLVLRIGRGPLEVEDSTEFRWGGERERVGMTRRNKDIPCQ